MGATAFLPRKIVTARNGGALNYCIFAKKMFMRDCRHIARVLFLFLAFFAATGLRAQYIGVTQISLTGKASTVGEMPVTVLDGSDGNYYIYQENNGKAGNHRIADAVEVVQKECCHAMSLVVRHPEDFHFVHFYEGTDILYAIYSHADVETGTFSLYLNRMPKREDEVAWDPQLVLSVNNVKPDDCQAVAAISPDGHALALTVVEANGEFPLVSTPFIALGDGGKVLWRREIQKDQVNKTFQLENMVVGNDGTVFTGILTYRNKTSRTRDDETFHLYRLSDKNSTSASQPIGFGYLCDARMRIRENGEVAVGGYYTNNLKNRPQGVCLMVFQRDSTRAKTISCQSFPDEYYERETSMAKIRPGWMTAEVTGLYEFRDGTLVLLGEQRSLLKSSTMSNSNSGNSTTHCYYHCGDILVHFANADGVLDTMTLIHKYQVRGPFLEEIPMKRLRCLGYSHTAFLQDDTLQIFFSDERDNYTGKSGVPTKEFNQKVCLAGSIVTAQRKVSRPAMLSDPKKRDGRVISQLLFMDADNIIATCIWRRDLEYLRLENYSGGKTWQMNVIYDM